MDHEVADAAKLAVDHDFIQWVKCPTPERNVYWQQFADQAPHYATMVADARHLVLLLLQEDADDTDYDQEAEAIWQQLCNQLGPDMPGSSTTGPVRAMWPSFSTVWRAAAVVALVAVSSALLYFAWDNTRTVQYATSYGERKTIQLPDKSVIVLNANSNITIPKNWKSDAPREVHLQGEAYFSVTQLENRQPFTVFTQKGARVNVLGTSFNVYDRGQECQVVLVSGKVSLSMIHRGKQNTLAMAPGELVRIGNQNQVSRRTVDPELYTAWRDGKVYFDDYTLAQVAQLLQEQYGLQVAFTPHSLAEKRMTAFLTVESAQDILTTLAETFSFNIQQQDSTIHISSL